MKFESFPQLIEAIKTHEQYSNDIKLKRLKKQLQILSHYQSQQTSIERIELTSIGIELLVQNRYREGSYQYNLVMDFEYPFSRPQLNYLKKDSQYAKGKDLLDVLLQGNNWGPSLMITYFLDKIQNISEIIRENNSIELRWIYHSNQSYRKKYLQQMQIKLFQVQQFTWKYMIKSTKKRFLGLTDEVFLLFSSAKNDQNLLLDFWKPISQIQTAKASVSNNKKFNLEISFLQNEKQSKLYFGGSANIESILGHLNPIEMIQRKVAAIQKNPSSLQTNKYWTDNSQMIRQFTQLIEHYSLKDATKSERYIKLMKEMIVKFYESAAKDEDKKNTQPEIKIQEQQILT